MDAAIEFATLITWHVISVALIGRLGDEPLPVGTWLVYALRGLKEYDAPPYVMLSCSSGHLGYDAASRRFQCSCLM